MTGPLGRAPPASRYSPDMTKPTFPGTDAILKQQNQVYARELQLLALPSA